MTVKECMEEARQKVGHDMFTCVIRMSNFDGTYTDIEMMLGTENNTIGVRDNKLYSMKRVDCDLVAITDIRPLKMPGRIDFVPIEFTLGGCVCSCPKDNFVFNGVGCQCGGS